MSGTFSGSTFYGTQAGAEAYLGARLGDRYTLWSGLDDDTKQRSLVSAADYLNALAWKPEADTFAKRDATAAIVSASYELAALGAEDPEIFGLADQGSNIQSVNAGGAGVTYFNPTSARGGTASRLPTVIARLLQPYLAASTSGGPFGGFGQSGSDCNPFSEWAEYERNRP